MFGTFQQSRLRIEIDASAALLERSLTQPVELRKWLKFQRFPKDLPTVLEVGTRYTSWAGGALPIGHEVQQRGPQQLGLTLSQGIDGYHQWTWGDGWVQSEIAGISLLPINLGQTASLLCLKQFVVK
jgi:hypothetical protein